jgi:hypothetical protein
MRKVTLEGTEQNVIQHSGESLCAQRVRGSCNDLVDGLEVIDSSLEKFLGISGVVVHDGPDEIEAPQSSGKAHGVRL